jgi:4-methylaminobutanoate oxidase (formaldehyde-forming)
MALAATVIVGGGVIGLSTAYHLARRKFGKVLLLDKGLVGDGSSSRAAGIITGLLWSETGVVARKKSLELYRALSQDLDRYGYKFHRVGALNLFDEQSWPEREKLLPLYRRVGAPFEIMGAGEIRRRWPELHPVDDYIGLFDPLGGYIEPDHYLPALTKRNRELGVEIREHQKVVDFLIRNGRVAGVRTPEGILEAEAVVCTVYAWTRKVVEPLGLRLPVKAFVHQRYTTKPLPSPVEFPAINANPLGGYIRPAFGNRLLAGIETLEREEYRVTSADFHMSELSAPAELRETIMKNFVPLAPVLGNTSWETEKVGLITYSLDGEPILGPVAELPGFYVGVAFHSGGFAYNPVAGLLLAEFVAEGRTSIDVRAFSPGRFDATDVESYLGTSVTQRDSFRRRH